MFDDNLTDCLDELTALTPKQKDKVTEILNKYCPITLPQLPDLPEIDFHREDLIEDKYIPSPDLLASYNSNMAKTFNFQPKPENNKLKQLYGDTKVNRNTFDFSQLKRRESQNPLAKPAVLVEEKQETILKNLQDKRIEATIPQMEQSLRTFELVSLDKKEIRLENARESKEKEKDSKEGLSEWRKMREKMMKSLSKR